MKKGWGVLLAAVLTTGTLAGCNSKEPAKESAAGAGPVKFSVSFSTGGNAYLESASDINKDKWVLELEKRTNTDLDLKPLSHKEFDQKMSLMFAGNDIPDVVSNLRGGPTTSSMSGSVEAGVFMPLDDLLKENAPNLMKLVPKEAWEETSYDGKIYGIPGWLTNPSRRATFIRTDLLEKANLKQPVTVEEYLDVLRAFKKMGVENPYQIREQFKYADTFLGAYDVMPYQFELMNGEVVPKFFDAENMMKALQTYKTMYEEGLIPKDFATVSQTDYNKNIAAGKSGIWSANGEGLLSFRGKIKDAVKDGKVDIVASPKGPEGKGGHGVYGYISTAKYINSKVDKEKAKKIIQFFDWMSTEEAEEFFTFGIEGDTYTKENGKINYKQPKTKEEIDEANYRQTTLWMVHDLTYNKKLSELTEDGKDMVKAFDNVLSKEGVGGITFTTSLASFTKYPDLASGGDTGPKFILDQMIQTIYGKRPISDWPKVIEEYKAKGGKEIIKEATERYNKKEGVVDRAR
ncbi:extracellular solute-binding protein [Paenibacillus chitinolyticus]|uniref:extracellular solute-binding protein n=1 Tax=Paenibacillus chitinolyticus TaxID=79263 RepID=UPI00366C568D